MTYLQPVQAIEINEPAISCSAMLQRERALDLQEFKGRVIYLDFWATWCPPCKKSMPFLNALYNELNKKEFEVIAINVDEDSEMAATFLEQNPVNYLVAMDPTGECPKKYGLIAMPSAYLIDRQGKVRYIHLGFRDADKQEIRKQIMELLTERPEK